MRIAATVRATLRFAVLDVASLIPTVALWVLGVHAATFGTAFGLWLGRGVVTVFLWFLAIRPAQSWQRAGRSLDDEALLTIDASLAGGAQRFMNLYVGLHALAMVGSTVVTLSWTAPEIAFGMTELVCGVFFATAVSLVVMAMEYWLWQPFDGLRSELGAVLHERKLLARREQAKMVRAQLILGSGTTLGIFLGCFAMGWLAHIEGLRSTAQAELRLQMVQAVERQRDPGDIGLEQGADGEDATVAVTLAETLPAELAGLAPSGAIAVVGVTTVALGRTTVSAAAAVGDGRWLLASEEIDESLGLFVVVSLGIALAMAAPLVGTNLAHFNSLREQLLALGRLTRQVVERGEIRGLERIISLRSDEIDALVKDFNAMIEMFDELGQTASRIAEGDLRVEVDRPGELHDAFRGMIEQLHDVVLQIRNTAVELATTAAEIYAITQEQGAAARRQAETMRVVRTTVASLASSAEVIAKTADGVRADAEQSRDTTHGMIARIGELSSHAAGVRELLTRIGDIADRSDLLALNGSLEAVRAGEAGRGFALVAAEMRRLAERVGATVEDVRARVAEIDASGVGAAAVAEASRARAEQTAAAAAHISQVIDAQSQETEVAAQHVHYVTEGVSSMSEAIAQTQSTAEGLKLQADTLEQLTRRFMLRR